MRIGQIVFIEADNLPNVQTGIITRREKEEQASYFWYEVLCNDGQNHVLPAYLLSPANSRKWIIEEKTEKIMSILEHNSTKHTKFQLDYIHNQSQKLK